MADTLTSERRSWVMSRIRSGNTKPELIVRSLLHRSGFRFSLRRRELPGTPDIVLRKYRTVVFVHGCYWHRHAGCKQASTPKTRREFWEEKFRRNVARDARCQAELSALGWRVLVVWECEVLKDPLAVLDRLITQLDPDRCACIPYDDLPDNRETIQVAEKKLHDYLRKGTEY
jgi:DNA mismatch endonuclease (patch repair protein)